MRDRLKPSTMLSEKEAMDIALEVERLVNERLEQKAKEKGTEFVGMTDSVPGIRAVVNALHRNYL